MMETIQSGEARLEQAAKGLAGVMRFVAEVTDREVLCRLGPRGMMAITLPPIALGQALLLKSSLPGVALLPLLWCSVCYYMLRFRLSVSIEAAAAGALLAGLAAPAGTSWWTAVALFAGALGVGILRRWLYAEFCPAYAFACTLFALAVPVVLLVCGLARPEATFARYLATVLLAPLTGAAAFVVLDAVRRRLGLRMEFPAQTEPSYDPAYLYRPFAARGTGF